MKKPDAAEVTQGNDATTTSMMDEPWVKDFVAECERVKDTNPGTGNCWAACIASLLDVNLDAVPNFCGDPDQNGKNDPRRNWMDSTNHWLALRGLGFVTVSPRDGAWTVMPDSLCIITGKSPRGTHLHSVVGMIHYENEQMHFEYLHDPHPSGDMIDGEPTAVELLVVLVPSAAITPPPGCVRDEHGVDRRVLGTLPLTGDGCVAGIGASVSWKGYGEEYVYDGHVAFRPVWSASIPMDCCVHIRDCYSTRSAAESASVDGSRRSRDG